MFKIGMILIPAWHSLLVLVSSGVCELYDFMCLALNFLTGADFEMLGCPMEHLDRSASCENLCGAHFFGSCR